jgi:hypothetical protein
MERIDAPYITWICCFLLVVADLGVVEDDLRQVYQKTWETTHSQAELGRTYSVPG